MSRPVAVRGLPGALAEGERLVWRGAPSWKGLARQVLHIRMLATYLGALLAWCAVSLRSAEQPLPAAVPVLWLAALAAVALALVALLAWLMARTTTYTITDRRIIMRVGIALTMSVNLPLRRVEAASLRLRRDGSGDIPLSLSGSERIGYLLLWPHVRPWRVARTEPMLRAVPDAARVAQLLGRALAASAEQPAQPMPMDEAAAPGVGALQPGAAAA